MKSRFWTSPWGIPDLSFLNGLIYFFNFWVFWPWNILLLLEGKSQCSCTYSSRLSKNTHKGTDQAFLSTFQKTASVKESTSHLGINFHRSVLPWVLEVFRFFHSHLQRSVNLQCQRNTASFLNPNKKCANYSNIWEVQQQILLLAENWLAAKCVLWIISRNCSSKKSRTSVVAQKYFSVKLKTPKLI